MDIADSSIVRGLLAAIESTSNGVVLADLTQDDIPITFVNSAFEQMTGYSHAEVVGRNCRFLQGPETDRNETAQLFNAIKERRHHSCRLLNYRKDKSTFWNELTISPVAGDDGSFIGFVGIQHDVTQQVLIENELNDRIIELESTKQSLAVANSSLEKIAHFDPLTGLPSRRLFEDRLAHSLARAKRNKSVVAVAFMDLDGFKLVNDRFGHEIGDLMLCQVAERMRKQIRESDTLARQGGDEFVLLFDTVESDSVVANVCDRIASVFSAPFHLGETDVPVHLGVSIGIACYPSDGEDGQSLLSFADAEMYRSKIARRGELVPGLLQHGGQR